MANFLQNTPRSFNPYVQTLPVDSYISVGMAKQAEFDQGLQRAQGAIDSINSLPVAREVDRQYIQSAINSLRTGIKESFTADFSDNQFVNQIDSAAARIATDPIIQKSIASSNRIKNGLTQIDDAKKTGKGYASQNEWYFNSQVQNWMNSTDLNEQFNGQYNPFVDIQEEILKVYKEMPDSENLQKDAFRVENGKLVYNPTLLKGKSVDRVQNALNLVMQRADIQQQLQIDGQFNYRGVTPQQLYSSLTESMSGQIGQINQQIADLQSRSSTDKSIDSQAIATELTSLRKYAAQLRGEYDANVALLNTNPDALKTNLTRQKLMSSFVGAFASEVAVDNPLWKAYMEEKDFALDEQKFIWQRYNDDRDYELDKAKLQLDAQKEAREASTKAKKEGDASYTTSPSLASEELGKVGSVTFSQSLEASKHAYGNLMLEQANLLAEEAHIPLPGKQNADGSYSPNVGAGGYNNASEAWRQVTKLIQNAGQAVANGQPSTAAKMVAQTLRSAKDNISYREKLASDINNNFNAQLTAAGVKIDEMPYYLAAMVDKRVEGWQDIQKQLVATYGENYQQALGVDRVNYGDIGGTYEGPNYKKLREASKKLDTKLQSAITGREEAFRNAQGQLLSPNVQLRFGKPEEEKAIKQDFQEIVNQASVGKNATKGEAADLAKWLDETDREIANNKYFTEFDPKTNTGTITIQRGTDSRSITNIPRDSYFSTFGELEADNSFNKKFQNRLELTNWRTTDRFNAGRNDAYLLDVDPKGDYSVQYHLIGGTVPGTYRVTTWISNKASPQQPLIDGQVFDNGSEQSTQLNRAQVMGVLDFLKNPANIKSYLISKGVK